MIRSVIVGIAAGIIALSTSGCAALVAGYLIGDGMARSERTKACHDQINTINTARVSKGQEPWPDQCGS
jgi:hypothetical protein